MKGFLSRYRPRYVRALVYMMQASEYYVRDYVRWYHRTADFSGVERRKQLDLTLKAVVLFFCGYAGIFIILAAGIVAANYVDISIYFGIALTIIGIPFVLPYVLAVSLFLLNTIQRPVEASIIASAKAKLASHGGVRIAIAGSYGKTSMREIVRTILSEGKTVAAPGGSHNTPLAIAKFIQTLRGDEDVLVFEFGEYYPGDIRKLCEFVEPQWGFITGVNEAHLERFKTIDAAADTIFELAGYLKGRSLYINGESEHARRRASQHLIYDRNGTDRWHVESAESDLSGTSIVLTRGDMRISAKSKLLGLHMVGSLVAAADIAERLGLIPEQIWAGIQRTKPFEHRMEPRVEGGITWIDDSYNGNPDGVAAAIEFLATLKGRRFYVTPGLVEMGDRKTDVHRDIGKKLAAAEIEKVVLVKNSATGYIEEGLKSSGFKGEVIWFDDGPSAYRALPSMTVSGDTILMQNDWPDQYS